MSPLRDCGDGWNWQVPDVRYLDPENLVFQLWDGEWVDLGVAELHPRVGRVGFSRCLRSESIKASGIGCPATVIASVEKWRLEMTVAVASRSALGSGDVHTAVKVTNATALVTTDCDVAGPVYAELPFGGFSLYTGKGNALPTRDGVVITYDTEGVLNEPGC